MTEPEFKERNSRVFTATSIIPLIDLTSLNAEDNESSIIALCKKALTPFGPVAAICIYPKFVKLASKILKKSSVKIATVINFPTGDSTIETTIQEIKNAIADTASEIDMVFPYRMYISGDKKRAIDYVIKARELCKKNISLKIIIETGALESPELIKSISTDVIHAGANFIKTSTGKISQGATLEATKEILKVIQTESASATRTIGIKISGGIRTIAQVQSYIKLASEIMGPNWVTPVVFRIGASRLLDEILTIG